MTVKFLDVLISFAARSLVGDLSFINKYRDILLFLPRKFDIISGVSGCFCADNRYEGCLVQVGNGIELEAVGLQFESYRWRPCGVTWDSSRTVVVIKLRRTSALYHASTAFWQYGKSAVWHHVGMSEFNS